MPHADRMEQGTDARAQEHMRVPLQPKHFAFPAEAMYEAQPRQRGCRRKTNKPWEAPAPPASPRDSVLDSDLLRACAGTSRAHETESARVVSYGIAQIDVHSLQKCKNLRALDLSDNRLHSLAQLAHSLSPQLQELSVECNRILVVDGVPTHLRRLSSLSISFNFIDEHAFERLGQCPALRQLDVSFNCIDLDRTCLSNHALFPQLVELSLDSQDPPAESEALIALAHCAPYLRVLSMKHNSVLWVPQLSISAAHAEGSTSYGREKHSGDTISTNKTKNLTPFPSLCQLDLSGNAIESIDALAALSAAPQLQVVSVPYSPAARRELLALWRAGQSSVTAVLLPGSDCISVNLVHANEAQQPRLGTAYAHAHLYDAGPEIPPDVQAFTGQVTFRTAGTEEAANKVVQLAQQRHDERQGTNRSSFEPGEGDDGETAEIQREFVHRMRAQQSDSDRLSNTFITALHSGGDSLSLEAALGVSDQERTEGANNSRRADQAASALRYKLEHPVTYASSSEQEPRAARDTYVVASRRKDNTDRVERLLEKASSAKATQFRKGTHQQQQIRSDGARAAKERLRSVEQTVASWNAR